MSGMRRCLFVLLAACGGSSEPACLGEAGSPVAVGTVAGIGSSELSGLAASRTVAGLLWTHGDGGASDIYSIGGANAAVRGTLHLAGANAVDWEDIATGPCAAGHCVYVADTGDNDLVRATVAIFEVTEPASSPIGTLDAAWRRFEIRYPDGSPDVEALFVDPRDGSSYGVTKVDGGPAGVYSLPRTAGQVATAERIGTFEVPKGDTRVTAADLTVDECAVRLAIRTRKRLYELRGAPDASVLELLAATPHELPVADEEQGEGMAYADDGAAYFTISEGTSPTLWRVDVR
jgi:hypothetical protein